MSEVEMARGKERIEDHRAYRNAAMAGQQLGKRTEGSIMEALCLNHEKELACLNQVVRHLIERLGPVMSDAPEQPKEPAEPGPAASTHGQWLFEQTRCLSRIRDAVDDAANRLEF